MKLAPGEYLQKCLESTNLISFSLSELVVIHQGNIKPVYCNCLQKAFEAERTELLEGNRRKWETNMQGRRDQELDYMKQRDKRVEEYEQQLQHLRIQDAEEYNMVKIKLETDVQV